MIIFVEQTRLSTKWKEITERLLNIDLYFMLTGRKTSIIAVPTVHQCMTRDIINVMRKCCLVTFNHGRRIELFCFSHLCGSSVRSFHPGLDKAVS